jgi:hypothetical protein
MPTEVDILERLDRQLRGCRRKLKTEDEYYEGEQPLKYMAPALEAEVGARVTQLVINWPRMITDAYENVADIEGFQVPDTPGGDDLLWQLWKLNDGAIQSQQAHLESLIHGRSYGIVGAGDGADDPPVLSVEHPLQMTVHRDPRSRLIDQALKRWKDDDGTNWASLYLPKLTLKYRKKRGDRGWTEVDRDDHELPMPPVTVLLNRGRMLRHFGVSEFHDIIPLADAANKMATDMMISGEFHAMPRRWVVGMTAEDFEDEDGNQMSTWSAVAGRLWGTKKKPGDVQYGQFPEADLSNFHNTLKVLAQLAAQLAYLPQDYMSFTSDNPTSADAMRASESRKVKRAERQHTGWNPGWRDIARLMLYFETGRLDVNWRRIETIWRDPATPTVAQKADATVKLTGGKPIIPPQQARIDLGYTPTEIDNMDKWDKENAAAASGFNAVSELFRQPQLELEGAPA